MKRIYEEELTARYRKENRKLEVENAAFRAYIGLALSATKLSDIRAILTAAIAKPQ
jgi:hypothetical protein